MLTSSRMRHPQDRINWVATCMSTTAMAVVVSLAMALIITLSFTVLPDTVAETNNLNAGVGATLTCTDDAGCATFTRQAACQRGVCVAGVCTAELMPEDVTCPLASGKLGVCHKTGVCVVCNRQRQCPASKLPCEQPTCIAGGCVYAPAPFNTTCIPSAPSLETSGICNGISTSCQECISGYKPCTHTSTNPCIASPTCSASNTCISTNNGPEVDCLTGFCDHAGGCSSEMCASANDCLKYNPAPPTCRHYACTGEHCQLELEPFLTTCGPNRRCDQYGFCTTSLCIPGDAPTAMPTPLTCFSNWTCNPATNLWTQEHLPPHTPCADGVCNGYGGCFQCYDETECGGEDLSGCGETKCSRSQDNQCIRFVFGRMYECGTDGHSRCNGQGTCVSGLCDQTSDCTYMSLGACEESFCNTTAARCQIRNTPVHSDCEGGSCDAHGVCTPCDDTTDCSYLAPGICEQATCDQVTTHRCQISDAPAHTECTGGACDATGTCVPCDATTDCSYLAPGLCEQATCDQANTHRCQISDAVPHSQCADGSLVGVCDANKACVPCINATDCTGTPSECMQFVCINSGCAETPITAAGVTCASGTKVCQNGACVIPQCVNNSQCTAPGMHCSNTGCTATPGATFDRCEVKTDCASSLSCYGGLCRQCAINTDCPYVTASWCNPATGQCAANYGRCNSQSDCGWSTVCGIGTVTTNSTCGACVTQAACGYGYFCQGAFCLPGLALLGGMCNTNANCSAGLRCTAQHTCTAALAADGERCESTTDCATGTCRADGTCKTDIIVVVTGCSGDADCGDGETCSGGMCITVGGGGSDDPTVGEACQYDLNCNPHYHCENSHCVYSDCVTDTECPGYNPIATTGNLNQSEIQGVDATTGTEIRCFNAVPPPTGAESGRLGYVQWNCHFQETEIGTYQTLCGPLDMYFACKVRPSGSTIWTTYTSTANFPGTPSWNHIYNAEGLASSFYADVPMRNNIYRFRLTTTLQIDIYSGGLSTPLRLYIPFVMEANVLPINPLSGDKSHTDMCVDHTCITVSRCYRTACLAGVCTDEFICAIPL